MTDITTLAIQRETRPRIEDVIPFVVAADKQKTALNFIVWLRESKMAPAWSGVHNAWDAKCKGKTICKISLKNDGWKHNEHLTAHEWNVKLYCPNVIKHNYGADNVIIENLQSIIWECLRKCNHKCLGGTKPCIGGRSYTIFEKDFTGVCPPSLSPEILDPDEATLYGIKRILELEQQARKQK